MTQDWSAETQGWIRMSFIRKISRLHVSLPAVFHEYTTSVASRLLLADYRLLSLCILPAGSDKLNAELRILAQEKAYSSRSNIFSMTQLNIPCLGWIEN